MCDCCIEMDHYVHDIQLFLYSVSDLRACGTLTHDIWKGLLHTQQEILALWYMLPLHFLQNLEVQFLQIHFSDGLEHKY